MSIVPELTPEEIQAERVDQWQWTLGEAVRRIKALAAENGRLRAALGARTNIDAHGKAAEIIAVLESRTSFYIVWEQHTSEEQESIITEIMEVIQHGS